MKKMLVFAVLLIGYLYYSCSPTLYVPSNPDATLQSELLAGRKLYVAHCSSCHNLFLPQQFTAEKWSENLDEMQIRAKLSEEEKRLILHYLASSPSGARTDSRQ